MVWPVAALAFERSASVECGQVRTWRPCLLAGADAPRVALSHRCRPPRARSDPGAGLPAVRPAVGAGCLSQRGGRVALWRHHAPAALGEAVRHSLSNGKAAGDDTAPEAGNGDFVSSWPGSALRGAGALRARDR